MEPLGIITVLQRLMNLIHSQFNVVNSTLFHICNFTVLTPILA
jgi:hypothetical protein